MQPPAPLGFEGLVAKQWGAGAGHEPQDERKAGNFPLGGCGSQRVGCTGGRFGVTVNVVIIVIVSEKRVKDEREGRERQDEGAKIGGKRDEDEQGYKSLRYNVQDTIQECLSVVSNRTCHQSIVPQTFRPSQPSGTPQPRSHSSTLNQRRHQCKIGLVFLHRDEAHQAPHRERQRPQKQALRPNFEGEWGCTDKVTAVGDEAVL